MQTCAGIESGIEASVHTIAKAFKEERCEAALLIDARNAFNLMGRKAAVHNIQRSCPPIYQFLKNSYHSPSKLHLGDGTLLYSEEGVTQGDPLAMAMYSLATRNMIQSLNCTEEII